MSSSGRRTPAALAVGAAAAALVAGATASATPARHACTPGVRNVNGVLSRVFCGPARASVKLGGRTLVFTNGACERTARYFDVNIGIVTLGQTSKPRPAYFGIVVGRVPGAPPGVPAAGKDGVYTAGVTLALVSGGRGVLTVRPTVTLKSGRTRGTFAAKTAAGAAVSGSFSC